MKMNGKNFLALVAITALQTSSLQADECKTLCKVPSSHPCEVTANIVITKGGSPLLKAAQWVLKMDNQQFMEGSEHMKSVKLPCNHQFVLTVKTEGKERTRAFNSAANTATDVVVDID